MNGLFDPDITGFGHQPMGFDQLCPTLYQSYVVTGCKMILEGRFMSNNLDTNPVTGNIIIGGVTPLLTALPGDIGVANEARQYITITRGDQTPLGLLNTLVLVRLLAFRFRVLRVKLIILVVILLILHILL